MAQLTLLNDLDDQFPPVSDALLDPNGLLAVGGLLSSQRLTNAYRSGIFPWYGKGDPIMWWSPNPRCIIHTSQFHVSSSFARFIKKKPFKVTLNNAFSSVIAHCAKPRPYEQETWINQQIIDAYSQLHQQGLAHSIEVWHNDTLVGGVYGIFVANTFCGESMFSLMSNGSKIGLYALSQWLRHHKIETIDCQIPNQHLISLGAVEISRADFISQLNDGDKKTNDTSIDWSPRELDYE